jgi:hypothetical protein
MRKRSLKLTRNTTGPDIDVRFESVDNALANVDAVAFGESIIAMVRALRYAAESVAGGKSIDVRYEVADLNHQSPATATLRPSMHESSASYVAEAQGRVVEVIDLIDGKKPVPNLDFAVLTALREVGAIAKRGRMIATIKADGRTAKVSSVLKERLDLRLAEDEVIHGSVEGFLRFLNLHEGANIVRIYPEVGASYVTCHFPDRLKKQAKDAVDEYVMVSGEVRYRPNADYPYAVKVSDIEVIPPDDNVPTFESLRGAARHYAPGVQAEDLVREMRDGW